MAWPAGLKPTYDARAKKDHGRPIRRLTMIFILKRDGLASFRRPVLPTWS